MHNPIIAALDVPDVAQAEELVRKLAQLVGAFKVGSELFTRSGPDLVRRIRAAGAAVFLDLKFHDIPNTVARAVANAVRLDVQMLTVHTSGGMDMLKAAEQAAQETARGMQEQPPLVLGVTVLTSMDSNALSEIGLPGNVGRQVERLAVLAEKAGLRGLVCSPLEVVALRQLLSSTMCLVTPGIRGKSDASGDQKRTLSAPEALAAGADWLVVGRPIYAASDPVGAVQALRESIEEHRKTIPTTPVSRFRL
ncbi:MAG: orotidine-5'-phosphate decarboxylase [Verrucomicrobiota bacterium]